MSFFSKGILSVLISAGIVSTGWAASEQDQYEVAKTKLLFLLSSKDYTAAQKVADEKAIQFKSTGFEYDWLYLQGITALKQGQLETAAALLQQLDNSSIQQDQWLLDIATIELKLGNAQVANGYLSRWVDSHPKHVPGKYYFAMSFYELANYQGAIDQLQSLDRNTAVASISADKLDYLLAASAYKAGRNSLATQSAKKVLLVETSPYQQAANDILNNIKLKQGEKKWSAELSAKASYDSNVTLANGENQLSDVRGALQFDGSFQPVQAVNLSYQGAVTQHAEVTDYNLLSHKLTGEFNAVLGAIDLRLGYSYGQTDLDKEDWLTQHRFYLNTSKNSLSFVTDLIAQQYPDDESLNGYLAGISATQLLTQKGSQPIISATLGSQLHVNQDYELKKVRVNAGGAFMSYIASWQLQAKGDVSYTQYPPDSTLESKTLITTSIVGSKLILSQLRLTLSADSFWTISTPESFDYQRYVISSALAW
ncbi:tetratricopeptide repeat protein, partial [Reinekea sp.]